MNIQREFCQFLNNPLSDGCTSQPFFGNSFHSVFLGVSSVSSICLWDFAQALLHMSCTAFHEKDVIIFLQHYLLYIHTHFSFFSWLLPIFLGQSFDAPHSLEELTKAIPTSLNLFIPLSVLSSQGPKFSKFTIICSFPSVCVYHQDSKLEKHQEQSPNML